MLTSGVLFPFLSQLEKFIYLVKKQLIKTFVTENIYAFNTTDFQFVSQKIVFILHIIVPIDKVGFKLIAIISNGQILLHIPLLFATSSPLENRTVRFVSHPSFGLTDLYFSQYTSSWNKMLEILLMLGRCFYQTETSTRLMLQGEQNELIYTV